jgi:hypothetical protein
MQKLSGNSLDKFDKSCSTLHQESKKLSLHFSDLSTIVYAFSKFQQNPKYYWRFILQQGP